jgi:nitroimidazol reductase NimA-like FMN-containing flavoprotein (pyridoxamine 5'-phosphate oxidase superfamily)
MRRQDKMIVDRKEIEDILKRGILCRIAFADGDDPYLVTVNYGYGDGCIYFHTAGEGKKMDIIGKNPKVCFQVVTDEELVKGDDACRDFTMNYKSVVGYGRITLLRDEEEKKEALQILMRQHTGKGDYEFRKNNIEETAVLKITIDRISGKNSGY